MEVNNKDKTLKDYAGVMSKTQEKYEEQINELKEIKLDTERGHKEENHTLQEKVNELANAVAALE